MTESKASSVRALCLGIAIGMSTGCGGAPPQPERSLSAPESAAALSEGVQPAREPPGTRARTEEVRSTVDGPDLWLGSTSEREDALDDLVQSRGVSDTELQLLATDPDPLVRQELVDALLDTGDPVYRPLLESALLDPSETVRQAAREALEELAE